MIRQYKRLKSPDELPSVGNSVFINAKDFVKSDLRFLNNSTVQHLKIACASTQQLEEVFEGSGLTTLYIFDTRAESIDGIGRLSSLISLRLQHFPKIVDLSPLAALKNLQALELETLPSWDATRKSLAVTSLEPLASLGALEELALIGISPSDGTLKPLARLKQLRRLRISNSFPTSEFAYLSRELSSTQGDCLKPYVPGVGTCKKCGTEKVMLMGRSGKRTPTFVCENCNSSLVARHVQEYEAARVAEQTS